MVKLKPKWSKTDIPKDTKIKLWRIMRDNPTFDTFHGQVSKHFDEIFAGTSKKKDKYGSLSRDTYNALKDEIMQMPVKDVATLPPDLQGWIIELRPGIKEDLEELKQKAKLPQQKAEKEISPLTGERLGEHYDRLVKVAEALYVSLGFPSQIVAPLVESRVGGLVWGHWGLKGSEVYFGGEGEGLMWIGLLQHMDNEFSPLTSLDDKKLSFSQTLEEFKKLAAPLVKGNDLNEARDHPLTQSLRDALDMVIERRYFKDTCEICQDWQ